MTSYKLWISSSVSEVFPDSTLGRFIPMVPLSKSRVYDGSLVPIPTCPLGSIRKRVLSFTLSLIKKLSLFSWLFEVTPSSSTPMLNSSSGLEGMLEELDDL